MVLEKIYECDRFEELVEIGETNIALEFYRLLVYSIHSCTKEERKDSFEELAKILEYYYNKFKINLKTKLVNKKYLSKIYKELLEDKKDKKEQELIDLLKEIPEF